MALWEGADVETDVSALATGGGGEDEVSVLRRENDLLKSQLM
jgi:hypothetical protein